MTLPTKILLATDGSEDAFLAMRAAIDLSNRSGGELHVVHAWHSVPSTRFESYIRTQLAHEARELLAEQVANIKEGGGVVAEAHLREGRAVDEILNLAEELHTELIVMGSRGLGPVKRLALGSVSEGVVHHARCSVLALRGGADAWPPGKLIIGDDGSEAAKRAGEFAASVGGFFGARALLVRAYPRLPEIDVEGLELVPHLVEDELEHEERKLKERAAELEKMLGSQPEVHISVGDPADCILEAARDEGVSEKALVAVGSRGLEMVQRIRLGSVSTKVLRAAEGPVLICPHSSGPENFERDNRGGGR
jgi:nucleotide-binding universal stress UspA family protein